MNNKGFMMAEVIVVSAIVLVTMVGLYASYNKIFSLYNTRVDYYDVPTLYELDKKRDSYETDMRDVCFNNSISICQLDEDNKLYLLDKSKLSDFDDNDASKGLKDYISFLSTSLEVETEFILVMERCSESNADDCKYAYLEVFIE